MKDSKEISPNQISPKFVAQKCPVCNGWGTVSFKRITCHACEGKGYIAIPPSEETKRDYGNYTEK